MSDIIMDFPRLERCGIEEAVFCQGKSSAQIEETLTQAGQNGRGLLLTRLDEGQFSRLSAPWRQTLSYDPSAHCAVLGEMPPLNTPASIALVSGGSSDLRVCREALITLNYHGIAADLHMDLGVAGLWRLGERLPRLRGYALLIVVAGMEASLPTVLAGLVDAPVIAVPSSVGYGVAAGGGVALNSCLASCASGIVTVNIDNGFGAACAAIKFHRQLAKVSSASA